MTHKNGKPRLVTGAAGLGLSGDSPNLTGNDGGRKAPDKTVSAVLELLAGCWPLAFSIFEKRRRPLKVGIHLDIATALNGAVTPAEISTALACYVNNEHYLHACRRAGTPRIDLNGEPAGEVTVEEAFCAKLKLSHRDEELRRRGGRGAS